MKSARLPTDAVAKITLAFCPQCAASGVECGIAAILLPRLAMTHHRICAAWEAATVAARTAGKTIKFLGNPVIFSGHFEGMEAR
jgi:hypothetical protein